MPGVGIQARILFAVAIMMMMSVSGFDLSVEDDDAVTNDNYEQRNMDLIVSGKGNNTRIYMVYEDYSNSVKDGSVIFRRSSNAGRTWDLELDMLVNKSSLNKQIHPSIDVFSKSGNDTIVLGFMDSQYRELPGYIEFVIVCMVSKDNGTTWSRSFITPLSDPAYPSSSIKDPKVTFGPNGELAAAWIELDGNDRIVVSLSLDNGSTWSEPKAIGQSSIPQNPDFDQWAPSLVCDGEFIHVVYMEDTSYRPQVYYTRSRLDNGSLMTFSDSVRICRSIPYDYQAWNPVIETDGEDLHMVWWDFSTDKGGANNQDPIRDRPCIKYTRSSDKGITWKVENEMDVMVNDSFSDHWISEPDICTVNNRTVVGWWDYSLGHPSAFLSIVDNDGMNWSSPIRTSGYREKAQLDNLRVALADDGMVFNCWLERTSESDRDIFISRTEKDMDPLPINDLELLLRNETAAWIKWKPYTGPDLSSFNLYVSLNKNLPDKNKAFPAGSLYCSFRSQDTSTMVLDGLLPDTEYFCGIEVKDQNGRSSISEILDFKTLPGNKNPVFKGNISSFSILEGDIANGLLNISELIANGTIWDDGYNGYSDLTFKVEIMQNHSMIEPMIISRDGFYYLDISITDEDWHGSFSIRIKVIDTGWDGIFGNSDDRSAYSNWFEINVLDVNDPPVWDHWREGGSGTYMKLDPFQTCLEIKRSISGCIEDIEYSFFLEGMDRDGDPISFSSDDKRMIIEPDPLDPGSRSRFSITPINEDLPYLDINITMLDSRGASRSLELILHIENSNDDPFFTRVNDQDVLGSDDPIMIEYLEGEDIMFEVQGEDPDPAWDLVLLSSDDRIMINRIEKGRWNISIHGQETYHLPLSHIITFELYDKHGGGPSFLSIDLIKNDREHPPIWKDADSRIMISPIDDLFDLDDTGRIGIEWMENVSFSTEVIDLDNDELTIQWTFRNLSSGEKFMKFGNEIVLHFEPSIGNPLMTEEERFDLDVEVSDGSYSIGHSITFIVSPDWDNDNDGLPDDLEIRYFNDLSMGPEDDPDDDGYVNSVEMIAIDGISSDPTDPNDPTKEIIVDDDDLEEGDGDGLNLMRIGLVTGIITMLLAIIIGMTIMISNDRRKEKQENEDIERRVKDMEERQLQISSIYGSMRTSEDFGPDQGSMDEILIDTGQDIFHGEIMTATSRTGNHKRKRDGGSETLALQAVSQGPMFGEKMNIDDSLLEKGGE